MGENDTDGDGKDVREGGDPEKPGQDKINGMYIRVHIGPTETDGLQEESDG